jgi:integrase
VRDLPQATIKESYDEMKKARYVTFLKELGSNINFEDDIWHCDKRVRSFAEPLHRTHIYFTGIPREYKELAEYYAILRLLNGKTINGVKTGLTNLTPFFKFLSGQCNSLPIDKCDIRVASKFKIHLDDADYAVYTKNSIWFNISTLFQTINGFGGMSFKNPFADNPYDSYRKLDYKYIPDDVLERLDTIFKKEDIDLHIKCIYWILRLIPSRINEVLAMKMDCLKPYNGNYVIFIPTWKQNGGNAEPILRSIHVKDTGIAGYLLELIRKQQEVSMKIQKFLPKAKKGALFAHQRVHHLKNGSVSSHDKYYLVQIAQVSYHFKKICSQYNIMDKNGDIFKLTSHQFRHNGISDRLEAGFTLEQISDMTGHHGNAMIWNAYAHLDLKPKTITEKQHYVLEEPQNAENNCILFGGRILNMEEQLEKRLLKNIRAHRVRGGICSDITGCKSDMWNCIDCKFFIPEKEQLSYFMEQALSWRGKVEKFKDFPMIKSNALKNARLFEKIAAKIQLEGGACIE